MNSSIQKDKSINQIEQGQFNYMLLLIIYIRYKTMGNLDCCTPNEEDIDIILEQGEVLFEKKFLIKHPNIHKVIKEVELPKVDVKKYYHTIVQNQGIFLGKQNAKIRNGKGIMLYHQEGIYYIGSWEADQRHGLGVMINDEGNYYIGEWFRDKPHGYGEYYNSERNWIYKGKWKKGVKQGLGEEFYPDGIVFSGTYRDGLKNGRGKYSFQEGCYFDGQFVNDIAQGQGIQKGEDYQYVGEWGNNDFNGTAKCSYLDELDNPIEWYIGQFKDGEKSGYGQYRWSDGSVYKGQWSQGSMTSKGVFLNKK